MGKSKLTLEIEEKLERRARSNCERFAFEVPIKGGFCDFVTSKIDFGNNCLPHITCYEIKVSFADFKSNNGHNFYGEENYYVMPEELLQEIIDKNQNHRFHSIGIITYKNGRFKKKSDSNSFYSKKLTIEEKFKLQDQMLMQWVNNNGGRF